MAFMPTDKSKCMIWGGVELSCFRFAFRQLIVRIPQFFDLISQFQRKTIAKLKKPSKTKPLSSTVRNTARRFSLPEKKGQLLHAVVNSKNKTPSCSGKEEDFICSYLAGHSWVLHSIVSSPGLFAPQKWSLTIVWSSARTQVALISSAPT